jgi:hypothetical protein
MFFCTVVVPPIGMILSIGFVFCSFILFLVLIVIYSTKVSHSPCIFATQKSKRQAQAHVARGEVAEQALIIKLSTEW